MLPILTKSEQVFAEYIVSLGTIPEGTTVATGFDNDTLRAPAVICTAMDAVEDFPQSGIWHLRLSITVKEIGKDSSITSTLGNTVFQTILGDVIPSINSSTTGYVIHDLLIEGVNNDISGNAWAQILTLEVICALTEN